MFIRILNWIAAAIGVLLVVAFIAWLFRTDPLGPIAGKTLSGEESPYPSNWDSCNDHMTVAIELTPDDAHSVTTLCFVHDGDLIIPARNPSEKQWPKMALTDAAVRVKIGDQVYPAAALRDVELTTETVLPSIIAKYPSFAEQAEEAVPQEVWYFRIVERTF